jgi:ubiquitin-protein ligase E3 C
VTSEIDVQPFVRAALSEAEQLGITSPGDAPGTGMEVDDAVAGARSPPRERARARRRDAAAYGPRLGVLNNIPFAVPFDVRVAVFRGWIAKDMRVRAGRAFPPL